ncbi:MAG: PQQ-binding-like beta-propeller repeat protein [Gemmatimonadota bacterium]
MIQVSALLKYLLGPLVLVASVASGGHAPVTAPLSVTPVAMFRGDPAHTGNAPGAVATAFGGILWRFRADGPVRSSPALGAETLYVGSADGALYALDRADGKVRWKYRAGGPINSSPALAGGLVYFASHDGTCYALDAASGRLRWKRATGVSKPFDWTGDYYTASPVVADGFALFGSPDGAVYAFDAETGAERWKYQTEGRVRASPAVESGTVFVGSFDGSVYALDLRSGTRRWRFDTEGHKLDSHKFGFDRRSIQSSPVVKNGIVYAGARDGYLYAIDAARGSLRWRNDHDGSWIISTVALADSTLISATSDGHFANGLDPATGRQRWRLPTSSAVWSSPTIAGEVVLIAETQGTLHAVDRRTGVERWRYGAGGMLLSSPVADGGVVYLGVVDGSVVAIRTDAARSLTRAVFWDKTLVGESRAPDDAAIHQFFAARGYVTLDSDSLRLFFEARLRDRAPSVVIFAEDVLPISVAATNADTSLVRRYLNSGGKIVWMGVPPRMWPRDKSGDRPYSMITSAAPTSLLGVEHAGASFDRLGTTVTAAGKRWGIRWWRTSSWSVAPSPALTILSNDEGGHASAWVRSYGGPAGSGFVRYDGSGSSAAELNEIADLAEYWPARP